MRIGVAIVVLAVLIASMAAPLGAVIAGLVTGAILLGAGALILSSRIRFTLENDLVRIAFLPFFSASIPLSEVAVVEVIEYLRAAEVGGVGVRRRADGGRALLYDSGPAIGLTVTDGRTYAIRSRYPGEAVRAVREARSGRAG